MEKTEKYPNLSWQFTRWGGFAGQTDSAYKDFSTKPEKAADFIRAIREGDILFPTDGITPSIAQKLEDMGFTREEQQSHKNRSWTKEEFEAALRGMEKYYHIHHPYHTLMNEGKLTKKQLQGWVANRFYYQTSIPIKDANILANCPDRETRAKWTQRILDHDGHEGDVGGIEAWLQLGIAVGLTREELLSQQHVLPAVRFAVDAYVNFARRAEWHEAASSSLTELFAPKIHQQRLDNWPEHYPWVEQEGYIYFKKRLTEARRDVEHGLAITLDWYKTREQQDRMVQILKFKLDVLWVMADAMYLAYINEMPPYFNIA